MKLFLFMICFSVTALGADKSYQMAVSGKLKDAKGADIGTLTLGEALTAKLLEDQDGDKDGPGGIMRKKIRWGLAKKIAAGGVVTLTQEEVNSLKDSKIGNLPLSLFGPVVDALGE